VRLERVSHSFCFFFLQNLARITYAVIGERRTIMTANYHAANAALWTIALMLLFVVALTVA
jgi:hypothetical protein